MHEWAIAEAIVRSLYDILDRKKIAKLNSITLCIGELQQIETDILRFAIREILKNKKLAIKILVEKTMARCLNCGFKWSIDINRIGSEELESIHFLPEVVHAFIKCPVCGSRDFEFIKGRNIYIESVKVRE